MFETGTGWMLNTGSGEEEKVENCEPFEETACLKTSCLERAAKLVINYHKLPKTVEYKFTLVRVISRSNCNVTK